MEVKTNVTKNSLLKAYLGKKFRDIEKIGVKFYY